MKNCCHLQLKITLTIYLIALLIVATTFHLNPPVLDSCTADCLIPAENSTIWLPYSYPPCIHPGQPVLRLSFTTVCKRPNFLTSRSVSLDSSSGVLFAEERVCFYVERWHVAYSYVCSGNSVPQQGIVFLDHKKYATKRRSKRWMRRRNPTVPRIHFQQERYITEIPEDTPINSLIIQLHATHITNESMYYAMVAPEDSRSSNIFTLDTVSGDIRVGKALDRETLDRHVLKVTAYERLDPAVSASSSVIVEILDVQDNAPIFERNSYYAEIREDAPIGTTIASVFARDLDIGLNGEIVYSLGEESGAELLQIHSSTGVIQTAQHLDRELMNIIRIYVYATDKGIPPMTSRALLEIILLDVNDNAPVFEQEFCNVTIMENITVPSNILQIKATDSDSGQNGKVHYSIVASSINGFSIDYESGWIKLHQKLDSRSNPATLLVRAKDSGQPAQSSTINCALHIIDINDHKPHFVGSQQELFVEENVPIGYEITRIFAIDEDSGINGRITYTLEGEENANETFRIDRITGIITTISKLDREEKEKYILKMKAEDGGEPPLSDNLLITIIVRDINDNAPYFEPNFYNITVPENEIRGTSLISVKAIDHDNDDKIVYRIERADKDIFSLIHSADQGAILSLSGEIDRMDDTIHVIITATDKGGLTGTCTVTIIVTDVNTAPIFLAHPFTVHIRENIPIGSEVIQLKAEDQDRHDNAKLTYSLDRKEFSIDKETGLIVMAKEVDREERSSYLLNVTVTDHATNPLSASTFLEIILDDVNDNAPEFTSENYTVAIAEDTPIGTSFTQVAAVDVDEGDNAIIDYYLIEENGNGDTFKLDRSSGTLRVVSKLDREMIARYQLTVKAQDRGNPPLSSFSTVSVVITDVNDNAPQFESLRYDLWIAENSPIDTTVGTIIARDQDEDDNALIQFRIFGGIDAKLFDIETDSSQNGVAHILSRTIFDYEAKKNHFFLEIQASSGQLSSIVPVYVHVSDVNDNRPQLRDFTVLYANHVDEPVEREIGYIPAFDPDHNATLEYSIEINDILMVDQYKGSIMLKNVWKRYINAVYKICVSDGPNNVCAKCRFIYIPVDDAIIRNAVTVGFPDTRYEELLDNGIFERFTSAISLLNNWHSDDIWVFSIHTHNKYTNVSFVVHHAHTIQRSEHVEGLITNGLAKLSDIIGMRLMIHRDATCSNEPCPYFQQCRNIQKYVKTTQNFKTDNFLMHSLDTVNSFQCQCPVGFISSDGIEQSCNHRLDMCFTSPCQHQGTCVPLENGYRCDCPPQWTGENCENSIYMDNCLPNSCFSNAVCKLVNRTAKCVQCRWHSHDTDSQCRLRSISFGEDGGYIVLPLQITRMEWKLQFSIATVASNGVLLFVGNLSSDFLEVSLQDALVRGRFSLGHDIYEVTMDDWPENRVNDGKWHQITLDYYDNKLIISLNDCDAYIAMKYSNITGYRKCAVEVIAKLPKKCEDPAVSCYRFFDLPATINLGGRAVTIAKQNYISGIDGDQYGLARIQEPFVGCISNLTFDGTLLDFSKFEEFEKIGDLQHGCKQKRNDCHSNPCHPTAICEPAWDGYHCRCKQTAHTNGPCIDDENSFVSLYDEESFVFWNIPDNMKFYNLSFEFRTRSRETQVIAAEFFKRSQFIIFSVSQGKGLITIGSEQYFLSFPNFADGNLKSFSIAVEKYATLIVIDHLYKKRIVMPNNNLYRDIRKVYSGLAPSTSYPQRFEGCIRNVKINDLRLKLAENMMTKPGCQVPNACNLPKTCPVNSICVREWDRHRCECKQGFIGDGCVNICSLPNLCGRGGVCHTKNSSTGYECNCSGELSGRNCERKIALQVCPKGWYGTFPNCKQCSCDTGRGFLEQCNTETGECYCKSGTYYSGDECISCDCGYGSSDLTCTSKGQCQCIGEAVGRRCDRCRGSDQVLDRKTLKCLKIKNRCPSNIEYGIQWPTTIVGATARQSCPNGEVGLALRKCLRNAYWDKINNYNCTLPAFTKLDLTDRMKLAQSLRNVTSTVLHLKGVNVAIARKALKQLIKEELSGNDSLNNHLKSTEYTNHLLKVADSLLKIKDYPDNAQLIRLFNDYGIHIANIHQIHSYLKPFMFCGQNMVFAVDEMPDGSRILPKFKNFVDERVENFPSIQMKLLCDDTIAYSKKVIFYSMFNNIDRFHCKAPIVAVYYNATCAIQVLFPVSEEAWKYPECVIAEDPTKNSELSRTKDGASENMETENIFLEWSAQRTALVGLNRTHAICNFERSGVYTIIIRPDHGALIRFIPSKTIPYAGSLCVTFALVLLLLSAIRTLYRPCLRLRLIRFGFILMFVFDVAAIFLVHRLQPSIVFCLARNTIISLCTSAVFAWLFMYSFHIYRLLATGKAESNYWMIILCSIIIPIMLSLASFFFAPGCSLSPNQPFFWVLLIPIVLYILFDFYAFSTALLISFSKQFDCMVTEYSIRATLWLHIVLSILCLFYNSFGFYILFDRVDSPLYEIALNSTLVFVATYIFLWTYYFGPKRNSRYDSGLWMNNLPKSREEVLDPQCQTPLLLQSSNTDAEISGNCVNGWMPDIIPSVTYAHQESTHGVPHPKILSPPMKILHHEAYATAEGIALLYQDNAATNEIDHVYGTYSSKHHYPSFTFSR
ncbi:Cadherin domain family protein [Acanthocheilonema viteae]